jgi:hypothetical protein
MYLHLSVYTHLYAYIYSGETPFEIAAKVAKEKDDMKYRRNSANLTSSRYPFYGYMYVCFYINIYTSIYGYTFANL